jgi:hypothetical protein
MHTSRGATWQQYRRFSQCVSLTIWLTTSVAAHKHLEKTISLADVENPNVLGISCLKDCEDNEEMYQGRCYKSCDTWTREMQSVGGIREGLQHQTPKIITLGCGGITQRVLNFFLKKQKQ